MNPDHITGWKDLATYTGLPVTELERAARRGDLTVLPRRRSTRARVRFSRRQVRAWYRAEYQADPPGDALSRADSSRVMPT